jgi:CRP-like cAMP-binding protein
MLNHIIDSKSLNLNLSSPKWEEPNLFHILSQDKPRNVFKGLPSSILYLLSGELGEPFTFDANEVIIDNAEIGKHVFLVKKGGCIV